MELAPIIGILLALLMMGNNDEEYHTPTSHEKPFLLERDGRFITVKDRRSSYKQEIEFDTSEEANKWDFDVNQYDENPNTPNPKRTWNITRK